MTTQQTYRVTGMTCAHCVASVIEEVTELPGVTGAAVDLDSGALTLSTAEPVADDAVRSAVEDAGYALA